MRRPTLQAALLAAIAALSYPLAPAHAWVGQKAASGTPTSQLLIGNGTTAAANNGDRFFAVGYSNGPGASDVKSLAFPFAGTISSIRFYAATAPTSTATWKGTLYKNGSATALLCTITSSSTAVGSGAVCTASTNISVAIGDWLSFQTHPSNAPTVSIVSASFVFTPTTPNDTIIAGAGITLSNSTAVTVYPSTNMTGATPSTTRYAPLPDGGTIDLLQVVSNAPGAGTSYDYALDKNASAQTLTCQISGTGTSCPQDTTHTVSVAAGDDIAFRATPTSTPSSASPGFGARGRWTTVGAFMLMMPGKGNADSATLATYYPVSGGVSVGGTTEASVQNISDSMTITKLRVKLLTNPGTAASGKQRVYTLRVNGVDTALTCTILETATTCSATGSVAVAANDLLSTSDVPTSSPATNTSPGISYLATR